MGSRGSTFYSLYEGLGILGESGRSATLHFLAERGLPEEEIPYRLSDFVAIIRQIFGTGASVLESQLERQLMASKDPALFEWETATAYNAQGAILR